MSSSEAPEICWTAFMSADQPALRVRASVSENGRPVKNTAAARRSSSSRVRRYSARKPIFFSFDVVPAMASAVSTKRRMSSFPLHQNLEAFSHASRKNQVFDFEKPAHRGRIARSCESFHLLEDSAADEVVHLSCEKNRVE